MQTYGFEHLWTQDVPEIKSTVSMYRYAKNGAELLSIHNSDENKVFGIAFRTPPKDSSGVAHILEHSVLCGSRKYPVKEPFVELLKGSLQTFLNAMTFPDKTCYPVASQNEQDLYNLIDVYLDAVFYPRITPEIFAQEGWHYEYASQDGGLQIKGVVYNEMKGAYSSPDGLLHEYSQQTLFPDSPYGLDSGGHPEWIPTLTYEDFLAFHRKYYHPSNAKMFFYGDDDPEKRLQKAHEYLKDFEPIEPDSQIGLQPRTSEPVRLESYYPADDPEAKSMLTVNWLLDVSTDVEKALATQILEVLLIGMPSSPLRKALLDSGLGEDLAGVGLETDLRQMYFSTGLKGISSRDLEKVPEFVFSTLQELSSGGFDARAVEAAVNTVEFELRENNSGSLPRGLVVMIRALTTWLHDKDPTTQLAFEEPLSSIKARLESGEKLFERMVQHDLLENDHRSVVILRPDKDKGRELEKREQNRLQQMALALSREEKSSIMDEAEKLRQAQEEPDDPRDLARIPSLKVSDLPREVKTIPIEVQDQGQVRTLFHELDTHGVVYLDLAFDLRQLHQKLLGYIPLFGRCLVEMGTDREDDVSFNQRIQSKTGGIHAESFTSMTDEGQDFGAWMLVRGKAMQDKVQDFVSILEDVLLRANFDNRSRFRQLVLEEKAKMEQRLIPAGHQMVNMRLRAKYSLADWTNEHLNGISYLLFLRYLLQEVDTRWDRVLAALEEIRDVLISKQAMVANLTLDGASWSGMEPAFQELFASLPDREVQQVKWLVDCLPGNEGLTLPSQVNYVGKGVDLYAQGYTFAPSSLVVNRYLRTGWLWDKLRVQGGAYGAFSLFDHLSGVLTMISYRDPQLMGTLDVYDRTGDFLQNARFDEAEIERAVIGSIGDMDRHQLPDAKGLTSMLRYLTGETDEKRQARREAILATTREDFRTMAQWYSTIGRAGKVVVLGDRSRIDQAVDQGLEMEHIWDLM